MMSKPAFSPQLTLGASHGLGKPLRLTLPVPPSTNHLYVTVHKRRVLSAEGRKYKKYVGQRVPAYRQGLEDNQWLVLTLTFYVPLYNGKKAKHAKKQWDVTNRVKALEDAICEALGVDDRAVKRVVLDKVDAAARDSRVEVSVTLIRE